MAKKVKKVGSVKRHRSLSSDFRRLRNGVRSLGNALAPFGVASIFKRSTPIRREPYSMERQLERPAKPLRNNWLDPFRSVCADRKERRSVLFATKKVGKGKAIHTPKTFSIRSSIKCKG